MEYLTRRSAGLSPIAVTLLGLFVALPHPALAQPYTTKYCPNPDNGSKTVPQGDNRNIDLVINGACTADGKQPPPLKAAAVYVFHNVNVVSGGSLTFLDAPIDFHAESILVENQASLIAGSPAAPIGSNPGSRLIIYLYGAPADAGVLC